MKVWVLTAGYKDDYRVIGVFSTEAKALEIEGEALNEPFDVTLDETLPPSEQGLHLFRVRMKKTGEIDHAVYTLERMLSKGFAIDMSCQWCVWEGYARDTQHAVAMCDHKRKETISAGEWDK